jgi:hypothetical protein
MSAAVDKSALLRRMREKRMSWVELEPAGVALADQPAEPAKRVRVIRPTEVEIGRHLLRGEKQLGVDFEDVVRFTVGWEGFTEVDLLGRGIGASDPLGYDAELWAELLANRTDWLQKLAKHLLDAVSAYVAEQADARKN